MNHKNESGYITIMEKPDWITFDDIHDLLYRAHSVNREKRGFHVPTAEADGNQLKQMLGEKGKCFVALKGDKLVGTSSYRILKRNYWCASGEVVDRILIGVLPEYQGCHIAPMLFKTIENEAKENGFKYIETRTAEANEIMQSINLKDGHRYIGFSVPKSDHYNVIMLQWLEDCPYPLWYTNLRYQIKKATMKMKYKPGRIPRFSKV